MEATTMPTATAKSTTTRATRELLIPHAITAETRAGTDPSDSFGTVSEALG